MWTICRDGGRTTSNINTIDLAGMPPGPHKILIELVNANHEVFPGKSKTVTFTVGKGASQLSLSLKVRGGFAAKRELPNTTRG